MPASVEHVWTPEEVRLLPDDGKRYECIDGELLVSPSPSYDHQYVVLALCLAIAPYVARERSGVTLPSPSDLEVVPGTLVRPDLFVAARPASGASIRSWQDITALLLAV